MGYDQTHSRKNYFSFFLFIFFFCIMISFAFLGYSLYLQRGYEGEKETIEAVQVIKGDPSEEGFPVESLRESPVNSEIIDEASERRTAFLDAVKDYSDVVLSVIISICVALVSITATIFIFSKSALDRINDENEYVSDVVNIHKKRNIIRLAWICAVSAFLILLPIIWHGHITFVSNEMYSVNALIYGLLMLIAAILVYFVITGMFWNNCVCVEKSLEKIIADEFVRLENNLKDILPSGENEDRLSLIGDWCCWEDKKDEEYIEVGRAFCQNMSEDKFIDQFQKAERLLLSGESYQNAIPSNTNIITIIQERINILEPNSRVEQEDLKQRFYIEKSNSGKGTLWVIEFIRDFETRVGFNIKRDSETGELDIPADFFDKTENLYNLLKDYRNLLISKQYTQLKINNDSKEKFIPDEVQEGSDNEKCYSGGCSIEQFVQAYYYFFLRILAVFSSSVRISNFSLNGSSLNYANFYSSTLENITLYSAECYRTVFARVKFMNVIMDISRFFDIDFYCARLLDSSFNNASMENVQFERATVQSGGFDSCDFVSCSLLNSDFVECIFNNSEFKNTTVHGSNFSGSKFREVKWNDVSIDGCTFKNTEFYKWDVEKPLSMKNCDFSGSIWSNMTTKKWCLDGGVFDDADLSSVRVEEGSMKSASLLGCHLDSSQIFGCDISGSALQNASLFGAEIKDTDFSTADLLNIVAVEAGFVHCDFSNSNCAEADFSKASIIDSQIYAARLYDCAMVESHIKGCKAQYLLADHLQFTFAKCENSDFSYSSLAESNLTKSRFSLCAFKGCDLTDMNATQTVFENCELIGADFSGTRFVNAHFCGSHKKYRFIKKCNFSSCKFENVRFDHIIFWDCLFDNAIFAGCEIGEKIYEPLTEENFCKISNRRKDPIIWL